MTLRVDVDVKVEVRGRRPGYEPFGNSNTQHFLTPIYQHPSERDAAACPEKSVSGSASVHALKCQ
jgi:hypothetical protein